ncbi:LysR family transcriptional regulator [Neobacillus sp. DY30]|uniref:LysR family transcriptional regulator n=1 Tax=Neobacillus sp. DY30 TaxID=3047871 RepID=UPI0024C084C6|nr:LysR family transcriptional regulator [Neobacillus sp. DY30]WHY00674.1 LysR family transcriptional regulator [Neobacillus sp. DY30]
MELRQIQYFMEVAKREHVTEAATALHVAQSAVSRQIFNLEEELGVNLFIREGRNVKLTMIGQMFLEHMEQAMKVIDEAQREIKEYLDPMKETIRIVFPKEYILRKIIVQACEQLGFQPKVSFEGVDIDSIKGLVSAGLGITLIPEITLVDGFPRSTVKVPVIEPEVTRTVGVIIPRERKMLPTVRLFYDFLKDFFSMLDLYQR